MLAWPPLSVLAQLASTLNEPECSYDSRATQQPLGDGMLLLRDAVPAQDLPSTRMRVAVDVHAASVQAMRTGSIGRAAAQHHRRRAQKPAYAQYDTGTRRPSHRAEAPDEASGDVQALVLDEDVRECVAVFDVQHRVADVRMVSRSTQQTRPDTMIMAHVVQRVHVEPGSAALAASAGRTRMTKRLESAASGWPRREAAVRGGQMQQRGSESDGSMRHRHCAGFGGVCVCLCVRVVGAQGAPSWG